MNSLVRDIFIRRPVSRRHCLNPGDSDRRISGHPARQPSANIRAAKMASVTTVQPFMSARAAELVRGFIHHSLLSLASPSASAADGIRVHRSAAVLVLSTINHPALKLNYDSNKALAENQFQKGVGPGSKTTFRLKPNSPVHQH